MNRSIKNIKPFTSKWLTFHEDGDDDIQREYESFLYFHKNRVDL